MTSRSLFACAVALLAVASIAHRLTAEPITTDPAGQATKQIVDSLVAEQKPAPKPEPSNPNLPGFVQNGDGSWSGHHCITSPVFCTAAVVQCLTTENDAEFLNAMAKRTNTEQLVDSGK